MDAGTVVQWFHDGISEAEWGGGGGLEGGRARRSETIGYALGPSDPTSDGGIGYNTKDLKKVISLELRTEI